MMPETAAVAMGPAALEAAEVGAVLTYSFSSSWLTSPISSHSSRTLSVLIWFTARMKNVSHCDTALQQSGLSQLMFFWFVFFKCLLVMRDID